MFRPCIDLHSGQVKQIVGATLSDSSQTAPETNFSSSKPADFYAKMYRDDALTGGHVIMLGPGNQEAALLALRAYPNGLQIGGGINTTNAQSYLEAGASHVIITSFVFKDGQIHWDNLKAISQSVGPDKLVLDLSCKKTDNGYFIATDRWQNISDVELSRETIETLAPYCCEFLIHAVDVEGLCSGIDYELVEFLGQNSPHPVTYAGGANHISDIEKVYGKGNNKVSLTIGSALDIFGGKLINYRDCVEISHKLESNNSSTL